MPVKIQGSYPNSAPSKALFSGDGRGNAKKSPPSGTSVSGAQDSSSFTRITGSDAFRFASLVESLAVLDGDEIRVAIPQDMQAAMEADPEFRESVWEAIGQALSSAEAWKKENAAAYGAAVDSEGSVLIWDQAPAVNKDEYIQKFLDIANNGGIVRRRREEGGKTVTEIHTPQGVFRWLTIKKLNYSPAGHLSKLARLQRTGDVRSMMVAVRAGIRHAKADKGLDKNEVRRAVAQMEGVLNRARVKIKNLKAEEQLELRRKRAEQARKQRLEQQLSQEIKKKRTLRKIREYGLAKTCLPGMDPPAPLREEAFQDVRTAAVPDGAITLNIIV